MAETEKVVVYPKYINLFFKQEEGFYDCIVTTKDEIKGPYKRKITAEIFKTKEWRRGDYIGGMGAGSVSDEILKEFTDELYFYINAKNWGFKSFNLYMALPKDLLNGEEHHTEDLSKSIKKSSCNIYLYEK